METQCFPPGLEIGSKVWTADGYPNHGQLNGPKQNIPGPQRGIVAIKYQESTFSNLYVIKWDQGGSSTHYARELFCIGRFDTVDDFKAAIIPIEPPWSRGGPRR